MVRVFSYIGTFFSHVICTLDLFVFCVVLFLFSFATNIIQKVYHPIINKQTPFFFIKNHYLNAIMLLFVTAPSEANSLLYLVRVFPSVSLPHGHAAFELTPRNEALI